MRMKNVALIIPLLLFFSILSAQEELLNAITIPDELTKSANAVIRHNSDQIDINQIDEMVWIHKRIVTVLNEKGNKFVRAYAHYDSDTKVNKIQATVYNAFGKKVKQFKKKDFNDASSVSDFSLYEDDRILYLEYTPTNYPYTMVFEKQIKTSSTAYIPNWTPLEGYLVSTEISTYQFNDYAGIGFDSLQRRFEGFPVEKKEVENGMHFEARNIPAIKKEQYSPAIREIIPRLDIALKRFNLKGVQGSAASWKEFGQWYYQQLLIDKFDLKEDTKTKMKELVKNATSKEEKARIVYEFVQKKTRYISVQLGIGGWEPMLASEVDKLGYGDCKALTNYTSALLDAVGVESYHTLLYSADDLWSIDKDLVAPRGNHMILNVPIEGEDIWLECTSQSRPFGFIANADDDREVVVITPEGAQIKRTKQYKAEENTQNTIANFMVSATGGFEGKVEIASQGTQYGYKFHLENESAKDQKDHYKEYWGYINNVQIGEITFDNDKKDITFTEKLSVKADNYATITQDEMLLEPNAFNRSNYVPKRYRSRKQSFQVDRGYLDEDIYTIVIPEGYTVKMLPDPISVSNKFGDYEEKVEKVDDQTLKYHRKLLIKKGNFEKEEYKSYRSFRKQIAKFDRTKVVLQKQ